MANTASAANVTSQFFRVLQQHSADGGVLPSANNLAVTTGVAVMTMAMLAEYMIYSKRRNADSNSNVISDPMSDSSTDSSVVEARTFGDKLSLFNALNHDREKGDCKDKESKTDDVEDDVGGFGNYDDGVGASLKSAPPSPPYGLMGFFGPSLDTSAKTWQATANGLSVPTKQRDNPVQKEFSDDGPFTFRKEHENTLEKDHDDESIFQSLDEALSRKARSTTTSRPSRLKSGSGSGSALGTGLESSLGPGSGSRPGSGSGTGRGTEDYHVQSLNEIRVNVAGTDEDIFSESEFDPNNPSNPLPVNFGFDYNQFERGQEMGLGVSAPAPPPVFDQKEEAPRTEDAAQYLGPLQHYIAAPPSFPEEFDTPPPSQPAVYKYSTPSSLPEVYTERPSTVAGRFPHFPDKFAQPEILLPEIPLEASPRLPPPVAVGGGGVGLPPDETECDKEQKKALQLLRLNSLLPGGQAASAGVLPSVQNQRSAAGVSQQQQNAVANAALLKQKQILLQKQQLRKAAIASRILKQKLKQQQINRKAQLSRLLSASQPAAARLDSRAHQPLAASLNPNFAKPLSLAQDRLFSKTPVVTRRKLDAVYKYGIDGNTKYVDGQFNFGNVLGVDVVDIIGALGPVAAGYLKFSGRSLQDQPQELNDKGLLGIIEQLKSTNLMGSTERQRREAPEANNDTSLSSTMTKFLEENDELLKDVLDAYKFEYSDNGTDSANVTRTSILELTNLLGFPEEDIAPLWLNNTSFPSNETTEEDPEDATDIMETTTLAEALDQEVDDGLDDRLANSTRTETTVPYRIATEANNASSSSTSTSTATTTTTISTTTPTTSTTSEAPTDLSSAVEGEVDTYSQDSVTTTTTSTTTTTTPGPSRAGDPLIDTSNGPTAALVGATLTGMGIVGLLLGTEFSTINRRIGSNRRAGGGQRRAGGGPRGRPPQRRRTSEDRTHDPLEYEFADEDDGGGGEHGEEELPMPQGQNPAAAYPRLDYSNYEYESVGNLDFTRSTGGEDQLRRQQLRKRLRRRLEQRLLRHRLGQRLASAEARSAATAGLQAQSKGLAVATPAKVISAPIPKGSLAKPLGTKLNVIYNNYGSNPELWKFVEEARADQKFLHAVTSSFDYNSLITLGGLWFVWNAYLVNQVPTTILLDAFNSITGTGRDLLGREGQAAADPARLETDLNDLIQRLSSVERQSTEKPQESANQEYDNSDAISPTDSSFLDKLTEKIVNTLSK